MSDKFKKQNNGIFYPKSKFPSISKLDLDFLKTKAEKAPNKRSRICVHPNEKDMQQEMFMSFDGISYIQPSHHLIDESIHIIEGVGKYIFFNNKGKYFFDVRLGNYQSNLPFYLRIPSKINHTLIPLSKNIVAHEVIGGFFQKTNTIFPQWSKKEKEIDLENFLDKYSLYPVHDIQKIKLNRISDEAFQALDKIIYLSKSDITSLKEEMPKTKRKRIRILVHPNVESQMHEMFVVYSNNTFVMVNKHLGKDESLHILEGEATFVFFDDFGKIINVTELSSSDKNKNFFIRVPKNIYHTIIIRSPEIVIHEATPGPFNKNDTIWAPWCPSDQDKVSCKKFLLNLEKLIKNFKLSNSNEFN